MTQRLKGFNLDSFLDSKIAEEQAKQAKTSQSSKRTGSNAGQRRPSGRTDSPARRAGSRLRAQEGGDAVIPGKAPDPEDFVIGDDASDVSRVATPRPAKEGAEAVREEEGRHDGAQDAATAAGAKGKETAGEVQEQELPEEVRKKLAKLESLTTRYQGTLLLQRSIVRHARLTTVPQICCGTTAPPMLA
jgi:hypothetical protein